LLVVRYPILEYAPSICFQVPVSNIEVSNRLCGDYRVVTCQINKKCYNLNVVVFNRMCQCRGEHETIIETFLLAVDSIADNGLYERDISHPNHVSTANGNCHRNHRSLNANYHANSNGNPNRCGNATSALSSE